jgi:hypothetical protein
LKKAPALLEEIKAAVTAACATSLPASALAKAANYTLALWPKLTRFLEYPELSLEGDHGRQVIAAILRRGKSTVDSGPSAERARNKPDGIPALASRNCCETGARA